MSIPLDFIAHIARYLLEHPYTAKKLLLDESLILKLEPVLKRKEKDLLRRVGGKMEWTLDEAAALKFRLAASWTQWQVLYNNFPGLCSVAKLRDHIARIRPKLVWLHLPPQAPLGVPIDEDEEPPLTASQLNAAFEAQGTADAVGAAPLLDLDALLGETAALDGGEDELARSLVTPG